MSNTQILLDVSTAPLRVNSYLVLLKSGGNISKLTVQLMLESKQGVAKSRKRKGKVFSCTMGERII